MTALMPLRVPVFQSPPGRTAPSGSALLQRRRCACGRDAGPTGECEYCRRNRLAGQLRRRDGVREGSEYRREGASPATSREIRIGAPGDALEAAADRAARRAVTPRPAPASAAARESKLTLPVATGRESTAGTVAPPIVHEVLATGGTPLDAATRGLMESRFGRDFSGVRVHADARAADSARAVSASAYTVGRDLVFASGTYRPDMPQGQELLAHELAHAVQQQGAPPRGFLQRKPDPQTAPKEVAVEAPQKTCEGALDITEMFRGFIRNAPGAIAQMPGLTDGQRQGYKDMLEHVVKNEGGVDIMRWKVLSCEKINLDLQVGDETFDAYFSRGAKEIGLGAKIMAKLIPALRDKEAFLDVLTTLAHEKRHATLGSSVSVPTSALKGEPVESKAQNAAYRVEEILAVTEEIAVRRMAVGEDYEVPEKIQRQFYRLSNMMKNWVTEAEAARLRKLVIDKLRERYGFEGGCDTSLTVGVVRCMDKNEWFSCDRENRTIYGPVPEGLHICTDEKHAFCRPKQAPAAP